MNPKRLPGAVRILTPYQRLRRFIQGKSRSLESIHRHVPDIPKDVLDAYLRVHFKQDHRLWWVGVRPRDRIGVLRRALTAMLNNPTDPRVIKQARHALGAAKE